MYLLRNMQWELLVLTVSILSPCHLTLGCLEVKIQGFHAKPVASLRDYSSAITLRRVAKYLVLTLNAHHPLVLSSPIFEKTVPPTKVLPVIHVCGRHCCTCLAPSGSIQLWDTTKPLFLVYMVTK